MALTFKCDTCSKEYEAQITQGVIYMMGSKRLTLKQENDDCDECEKEVKKAAEQKRQELKKQNGSI